MQSYRRNTKNATFNGRNAHANKARMNNATNQKGNTFDMRPSSPVLYIDSVKRYFERLLKNNCNAETYDGEFYKLTTLMKHTFKNSSRYDNTILKNINSTGHDLTDCIDIRPDSFNSQSWLKAIFAALPDVKLQGKDITTLSTVFYFLP